MFGECSHRGVPDSVTTQGGQDEGVAAREGGNSSFDQ
jgi:hypothetical protein